MILLAGKLYCKISCETTWKYSECLHVLTEYESTPGYHNDSVRADQQVLKYPTVSHDSGKHETYKTGVYNLSCCPVVMCKRCL